MPKTIPKLILGTVLLIVVQACAPVQPAPDLNAINTAVAQTLGAMTPTPAPVTPDTGTDTPTPTVTFAVPTETETPAAVITLPPLSTSTPAAPTLAPGAVQVRVSVPTNCRVGPGLPYLRVGALLVGEVAEVVGRHATRDYWVIRNPDRTGETCWLWGQYATLTGDTSGLAVMTPPPVPTPSPAFDVSYDGLESCTSRGWWVDIELENIGGLTFRSMTLTVRDLDTDVSLTLYADGFTDNDGCLVTETRDNMPPRAFRVVSSPAFSYDPSGHRLRATITLCSNPGQSGTCVTQTVNLRP